jgi:hypothetical protein
VLFVGLGRQWRPGQWLGRKNWVLWSRSACPAKLKVTVPLKKRKKKAKGNSSAKKKLKVTVSSKERKNVMLNYTLQNVTCY